MARAVAQCEQSHTKAVESPTWADFWCAGVRSAATFDRWRHVHGSASEVLAAWAPGTIPELEARAGAAGTTVAEELKRASRAAHQALGRTAWAGATEILARDELPLRVGRGSASPYFALAGKLPDAGRLHVGIVGTRRVGPQERRTARRMIEEVIGCYAPVVVSGGAVGVDALAHDAALEAGVPAVIVLAGGLGHAAPSAHRGVFARVVEAGGALLTERPPQEPPQRFEFVRRNRLIAALSDVVLVLYAPQESGTMATAHAAIRLGVPVLAMPGRPDDVLSAGCNQLLREGCQVLLGAADLERAVAGSHPAARGDASTRVSSPTQLGLQEPPNSPAARTIWEALGAADGDCDEELLLQRTRMAVPALQMGLLELELSGRVLRHAGCWRVVW